MQRVRIGLTGLACVFLLVLLAAALLGLARHEAELSGPPAADGPKAIGNASADVADDAPKDPLAELGVAPGNVPDKAKEDINAAAPAAPAGAQP
jgi:hypothetical protein